MKQVADRVVIERLQKQLLDLHENRQAHDQQFNLGLGLMESSFPGKVFPRGAVHELISMSSEEAACTSGFISVVLGKLMRKGGLCLWISTVPRRSIFPPALKFFGIEPESIVFVDANKPKETLWALEEALKCDALTAVVGELSELGFSESRRFQLAAERSRVTCFIHRFRPKKENAVACATRWKISSIPSMTPVGMPGLGFPRWNIELLKVRNGKPNNWQVQWSQQGLEYLAPGIISPSQTIDRQAG
jgi:protein ImuA